MGRTYKGLFPALKTRAPTTMEYILQNASKNSTNSLTDRGVYGTGSRFVRPDSFPHPMPGDFVASGLMGNTGDVELGSTIEKWPVAPVHRREIEGRGKSQLRPQPPPGKPLPDAPRFLKAIETKLDADLAASTGEDDTVFEVWEHGFHRLIDNFRTYGPLLTRIKAAYDGRSQRDRTKLAEALRRLSDVARHDQTQEQEIDVVRVQCDEKIAALGRKLYIETEQAAAGRRTAKVYELTKARLAEAMRQLDNARYDLNHVHETNRTLASAIDRAERLQELRDAQEDTHQTHKYTIEEQLIRLRAEHETLQFKYAQLQEIDQTQRQNLEAEHQHVARLQVTTAMKYYYVLKCIVILVSTKLVDTRIRCGMLQVTSRFL
jgi:hypothetical protein